MKRRQIKPNAPRFHALWEGRENKQILIMKKQDWDSLGHAKGTNIKLSLQQIEFFPFSSVLNSGDVLAAIAQYTEEKISIKIYRNDPQDNPTPINVDTYTVWVGLPEHLNIPQMIDKATTDYDDNFQYFTKA